MTLSRRDFLKLGAAGVSAFAVGGALSWANWSLKPKDAEGSSLDSQAVAPEEIPSTCMQCVAACGIIGMVRDGRLVKIEGNPLAPNNRGRLCARGQAGVNQVYDPDRLLFPMRRVGKRGEGKWKRISWDEALDEVAARLKTVRDSGMPEEFIFHYGRSRMEWILTPFMDAFGSASIMNHTSICESSKFIAHQTMWGSYLDVNDVANSKYILVMGCNPLEAHTVHNALCQRVIDARAAGARMVTFDVRLSNTAARSDTWYPVRPGTDGVVALAMANTIMRHELYDEEFIRTWTNVTVEELKSHLAEYTPDFAAQVSGIPAAEIEKVALDFATIRPSTIISYRGVASHRNGTLNERCIMLLEAIVGNIDVPGGRCFKRMGSWGRPFASPAKATRKIGPVDPKADYPFAKHKVSHEFLPRVAKGDGKIQVYWTYVINPPYVMPDGNKQVEILKNEEIIPFHVCSDAYYSENAALADLILPDATYLERSDPETSPSFTLVPFVQVRQPVVTPLGQSRPTQDVLIELARRLGLGGFLNGVKDSAEYLQRASDTTPGLKEAGGWAHISKTGVWYDQNKKPNYRSYARELSPEELRPKSPDERIVEDPTTGTVYRVGRLDPDLYTSDTQYVGIKINGRYYAGFKPYGFPTSGKFEIASSLLAKKGFPSMPSYEAIPAHLNMKDDELILTTFKVNVHTQSRTQNCKWLQEIHSENSVWINPAAAVRRGIADGDTVEVTSAVGSLRVRARVTEGINPGVVAISFHSGHWEYGRYASGKRAPEGEPASDDKRVWWKTFGALPNKIIPVSTDPIGGGQAYMDTVVRVSRVG